jgi:hypothetical protein
VASGDKTARFQFYINGSATRADFIAYADALQNAGWLDQGSKSVSLETALYNGGAGLFGSMSLRVQFMEGGRANIGYTIASSSSSK